MTAPAMRIGVDIGGTKIEVAALDANGREVLRRRTATPHGSYAAALETLAGFILTAEQELGGPASIGIGLPGALSPRTGLIKNAYATPFNGHPLKRDLEARLAREVRIENDANCFALSETQDGAARGRRLVFGAILGTGAGGGIVMDGRVFGGANAIGGEWGHNPLPWMEAAEFPGPTCYCGRAGCIERFVSGSGLAADHLAVTGDALDAPAIVAHAQAGHAACNATMRRYELRLARAFAHVINLLDPEVIVVGGGMSNVESLYANVPRLWSDYVFSDHVNTELVRAMHGDASGVRGAAGLWD
jgi:fructokinase